jgi:hypothetical protein
MNIKQQVFNDAREYGEYKNYLENVTAHGCASGIVTGLIYYEETSAFYEKHAKEINGRLREALDDHGLEHPEELFGNAWDNKDPCIVRGNNRNLLAWFAYEDAANELLCDYEGQDNE